MNNIYTVNEIAKEANVTNQAVYKRIKQSEDNENNELWYKGDRNETIITEKGREYLLEKFKNKVEEKKLTDEQQFNNRLLTILQEENNRLKQEIINKADEINIYKQDAILSKEEMVKERDHSRELSNELMTLAQQLADLNRNNQVLLLQSQKEKEEPDKEDIIEHEVKKSFWQKLFNKK